MSRFDAWVSAGLPRPPSFGGAITNLVIQTGGTGYAVNDVLTLVGGSNDATIMVMEAVAGVIAGFDIIYPGTRYAPGIVEVTGGSGAGATFNVISVDAIIAEMLILSVENIINEILSRLDRL